MKCGAETLLILVGLAGCGERWTVQTIAFELAPIASAATPDGYDRLQLMGARGDVSADVASDSGTVSVAGLQAPPLTSEYHLELVLAERPRASLPESETADEGLGHVHAAALAGDALLTVAAGDLEPRGDGVWTFDFDSGTTAPRSVATLRAAQILLVTDDSNVVIMYGDTAGGSAAADSDASNETGGGHDHGA